MKKIDQNKLNELREQERNRRAREKYEANKEKLDKRRCENCLYMKNKVLFGYCTIKSVPVELPYVLDIMGGYCMGEMLAENCEYYENKWSD